MDARQKSGKCPICSGSTSLLFSVPCDYRKPVNSKCYEVYWCEQCHYGQVWERPSKAEVIGFYELDDYYTHHATDTDHHQEAIGFFDRLRTHISWRLDGGEELAPDDVTPLLKGDSFKICEIGCGNGENLKQFCEQGFSVTGVEPDPAAREMAQKTVVNVFSGTAETLPDAVLNHQYDVVLMSHVLEHCLDINTAISNAKAILKDGGILIVETPNCNSHGFRDYQGEWPWSDIPRHLNFFTPSSLSSLLTKHGFRVSATKYCGFCRQFSNAWLKDEEKIWRSFASLDPNKISAPNFNLRSWKLLVKCMFSPKDLKYDSVRIIAVNP